MIPEFAGGLTLAVWIYLLAARGGFWRTPEKPASGTDSGIGPLPGIVAIVPARNEAHSVGRAIASLTAQDYPGRFHVVLVDDDSSDGTAGLAGEAAERQGAGDRLTIVKSRPLETGWTGKLWAVSEGVRCAASFRADYFLLTDADIAHAPDNVSRLLKRAEHGGLDLASLMVKLESETLAERALIPAFVFFFFLLYPPAWVARRDCKTAAAAGGCILIRAEALRRIGGIEAIRGELIDDCALARAVKRAGGNVWLGVTSSTRSIRGYGGFSDIGRMVARTAFTQLRHSALLLGLTALGMTLTYLAPPLLVFSGNARAALLGGLAWALMAAAFFPTLRFYGRSPVWAPLLPAIAAFYLLATFDSALRFWRGRGGSWKGRVQDPPR
ncbi:MAG: glycosyltransferase [Bryobacteraceae bacterium]